MKWTQVINDTKSMSAQEAKAFIHSQSTDSYRLIDVRQPEEYNKEHLPGAELVTLGDLTSGRGKLEKDKPLLLYCSTGSRSKAAAQWLVGQGYLNVWNIEGGISNWTADKAFGHFELNLNLLKPNAEFPDAISMAYAMEEGLRQFYLELARETPDEVYKRLYRKLSAFEVEHKRELAQKYEITQGKELIQKEVMEHHGQIMEGGGYADITLIKTLAATDNAMDVFSLAMAFETQALDFYARLAMVSDNPEVKQFFLEMADAEKKHLAYVTREMDQYLQRGGKNPQQTLK